MAKIIIAVDGPAASGKGTIAKRLAKELNLAHMDTGKLYRLVGAKLILEDCDPDDEGEAVLAAHDLQKAFRPDMTEDPILTQDDVGQAASKAGQWQGVRDALKHLQTDFAHNPPEDKEGSVLDGRDIGTVIAPDANVKLFITAEVETRAERRTKELQSKGLDVTYEAILEDMRIRDKRDSEREAVPMIAAEDAVMLDTSDLNAEQAFEKALEIVKERL